MSHRIPQKGFASLMIIILMFVISLFAVTTMTASVLNDAAITRNATRSLLSAATGESGLEDILYRIKFLKNYSPSESLSLNGGTVTTQSLAMGSEVSITSTGNISSRIRRIASRLTKNTEDVQFHYGVQVGDGGMIMNNNSKIVGNIYSNGDITGSGKITGDAWVAGGTQPAPDQSSTTTDSNFNFGLRVGSDDRADAGQSFRTATAGPINRISINIKKSGLPPNASVYILADDGGKPYKSSLALTTGLLSAQLVTTNYGWVDVTFSSAPTLAANTVYWMVIDAGLDSANYWTWAKDSGNPYASGDGKWSPNCGANSPSWASAGGDFMFKTWMGGVVTKISGVTVGGNAHAHLIESATVTSSAFGTIITGSKVSKNVATDVLENCTDPIGGNASYNTISGCTVSGTSTTPTTPPADPAPQNFPLSEGAVQNWQNDAGSGGTYNGNLLIDSSTTLGPKVITGNLTIRNNGTIVSIAGTVYVQGNILFDNNSLTKLSASYGGLSGVILSDGNITISNNAAFGGSGTSGSFLMILTKSYCRGSVTAQCPSGGNAISLTNNAIGAIFYAGNGRIDVSNGVNATELTGYQIALAPNAVITYQQGLANAQFSSGPGASWVIEKWQEVE